MIRFFEPISVAATLQTHIQEELGSNLGRNTDYPN
jgi:hypothetical protein